MIRSRARILAFAFVLFSLVTPLAGWAQKPTTTTPAAKPRLVLLIVADQFRYDYLERFGDLFTSNGLKRLMQEGASWADANYDHVPTYTAPGHATLLTGAFPAATGIVGNDWPDRDTGKKVSSVSDETTRLLGNNKLEVGSSPRRLLASTIGDELRLASNGRSKVIGMSLKDRSAILTVGRHANGAFWFSTDTGLVVSSDYYFKELPAWVADFNRQRPTDAYFGRRWERLLPEAEYLKRAGPDSPAWEDIGKVEGDTNAFPHVITGGAAAPGTAFYKEIEYSPFGNDLLLAFAERAIDAEQLGKDDDPDVLSISFSANDYVGHRYGPYSQEVMDLTLRFDRTIAALLDFVDARIGLKNTIVVFSADHGVAPGPKYGAMSGLTENRTDYSEILKRIRAALSARYNAKGKSPDTTSDYLLRYTDDGKVTDAIINNNIYFDTEALKRDGVNVEEAERIAGEAALTVPGVIRYFTRSDFLRNTVPAAGVTKTPAPDPIARRVQNGFFPRRSGNVIFVTDPFSYSSTAIHATHASPYSYDTHVPLILRGGGIVSGRYLQAATPADIAPTIAVILRIQAPSNVTGRILLEAMPRKD